MELKKIENRRFGPGDKIELDGKSFLNCTFDGCEVVYGGGETLWDGVTWRNCEFTLTRSANYTCAAGCRVRDNSTTWPKAELNARLTAKPRKAAFQSICSSAYDS